jgi:hypothetical protein
VEYYHRYVYQLHKLYNIDVPSAIKLMKKINTNLQTPNQMYIPYFELPDFIQYGRFINALLQIEPINITKNKDKYEDINNFIIFVLDNLVMIKKFAPQNASTQFFCEICSNLKNKISRYALIIALTDTNKLRGCQIYNKSLSYIL